MCHLAAEHLCTSSLLQEILSLCARRGCVSNVRSILMNENKKKYLYRTRFCFKILDDFYNTYNMKVQGSNLSDYTTTVAVTVFHRVH